MTPDRAFVKRAILGLLDSVAQEHPLKHQDVYAGRYVLTSREGAIVELMVQKDEKSPANIWCLQQAAGPALIATLAPTLSPTTRLWRKPGQYGRHSALEKMPQLGGADLACFAPTSLAQVGQILDRLWSVTPHDLS
jgi:hypothetical protein